MIIDRAKVRAGKNRNGGGRGSEGEGQEDEMGGGGSQGGREGCPGPPLTKMLIGLPPMDTLDGTAKPCRACRKPSTSGGSKERASSP